jgi:uncharacterized lipoprotein YmbA
MTKSPKALAVAVGLAMVGCSPLAPRQDYSNFYVLTPLSEGANPAPIAANSKLTIGVGPIDFPDYLKRRGIVTRTASNQIDVSPVNFWGGELDDNFQRILSQNLGQLLQTDRIEKYPWPRQNPVDYQIVVAVERFETAADGQAHLNARWIIKDGSTGEDLYASDTVAAASAAGGGGGEAAALSEDLGTLSRDIASRVSAMGGRRRSQSDLSQD